MKKKSFEQEYLEARERGNVKPKSEKVESDLKKLRAAKREIAKLKATLTQLEGRHLNLRRHHNHNCTCNDLY